MSGRKSLSLAQKRHLLLNYFHTTKSFYTIKEIESSVAKATGISSMQIKDILQTLLDDDLITVEKLGSMNVYWSFPSTTIRKSEAMIERLAEKVNGLNKSMDELKIEIKKAEDERTDTDERQTLLIQKEELNDEVAKVKQELQKYDECNPERVNTIKELNTELYDAASTYTDNIYSLLMHLKGQGIDVNMIRKEFNIPEDYDDIPEPY